MVETDGLLLDDKLHHLEGTASWLELEVGQRLEPDLFFDLRLVETCSFSPDGVNDDALGSQANSLEQVQRVLLLEIAE